MARDLHIPFRDASIDATLHEDARSDILIILCHGFTDSKNAEGIRGMAALFEPYYHVLRFTFTDAANPHLPTEIENLAAVMHYFRSHYAKIVVGHSLGGLAAITSAVQNREIDALVVINPFVDVWKKVAWEFRRVLLLGFFSLLFSKRMRDNYHSMIFNVRPEKITAPTLVVVAKNDTHVHRTHGLAFYDSLGSVHKKLILDETLEHGLHSQDHRKRVSTYIIDWISNL